MLPDRIMTVFTWKIIQLERELPNGFVSTAHYSVDAGGSVHSYGSMRFERPQGEMIPFEKLTEETVVDWIKNIYASEVTLIEAAIQALIDEVVVPTVAVGLPWMTDEYLPLERAGSEDGILKSDDPSTPDINKSLVPFV